MVVRSFFVTDASGLVVTSSSDAGLVGNSIINNSSTPDGTVFSYTGGGHTTVSVEDANDADWFNDDDTANHVVLDGGGIVANGTHVEAESLIHLRALDGDGNPTGPTVTITVLSQNGITSDIWGLLTHSPLVDGTDYVKVGGNSIGDTRYKDFITCFGPRTPIATPDGPVCAEDLLPGQIVWTHSHGPCPLRWVASTVVKGTGAFAPVVFAPGSIGNERRLVLSQQHRVFIQSARAELLFGQSGVLVAAKHLCGLPGVSLQACDRIQYTHIMFDQHVIVRSAGVLTESFFLSEHSLSALDQGPQRELRALFPALTHGRPEGFARLAAPSLRAHEARALCAHL